MKEEIAKIKENAIAQIAEAKDLVELNEKRVKYLGKKGELTALLRGMKDLSAEERPIIGNLVNAIKEELENLIKKRETAFKREEINEKLEKEKIDIKQKIG